MTINPYLFYPWTPLEIAAYHELKDNVEEQKVYGGMKSFFNPVERSLFLLMRLGLKEEDYENLTRFNGRPEVLCELELMFLEEQKNPGTYTNS